MRRKGFWMLTILLGLSLSLGGLSPVWGGEMDALHLINLLKKKGVLTQEEADDLVKEVRSNAKKEKTEIKKDMTKVAQKGDFLPKALKGFTFGSTLFGEWNYKNIDKGKLTKASFRRPFFESWSTQLFTSYPQPWYHILNFMHHSFSFPLSGSPIRFEKSSKGLRTSCRIRKDSSSVEEISTMVRQTQENLNRPRA